jgi:hypothetical protein
VHAADFSAAASEMNVRVYKTGKNALALRIDLFRSGANPFGYVRIGAHSDDPASVNGERFRLRMCRIDRPNVAVEDDKVSGRGLLPSGVRGPEQQ